MYQRAVCETFWLSFTSAAAHNLLFTWVPIVRFGKAGSNNQVGRWSLCGQCFFKVNYLDILYSIDETSVHITHVPFSIFYNKHND